MILRSISGWIRTSLQFNRYISSVFKRVAMTRTAAANWERMVAPVSYTHLEVYKRQAFAQGIFFQYGITEDDDCDTVRNGGLGSTDK